MEWYNYLAAFFSAAFLSNAIPHFIKGVSGDKFPTLFAKPPGKGLSTPLINVLWALLNIVISYVLLCAAHLNCNNMLALIIFFAGFGAMSVMSAINFEKKDKE